MADRHWVGGIANWDGTAGVKWALTAGGVGGQAVPTSSDDVFLDASSLGVTVTINATANCRNLDCTGFTGTLAGASTVNLFGNLTLVDGMAYTHTGQIIYSATDTGHTITTAGKTMSTCSFNGVGGAWTLQDNLIMGGGARSLTVTNGNFNSGGKAITCSSFSSSNSNTRTITLDGTTLTLDGATATAFDMGTSTATRTSNTFSATGATIRLNTVSGTTYICNFNGQTQGTVIIDGRGTGSVSVLANSSNIIMVTFTDARAGGTLIFTSTRTYTITNFSRGSTTGTLALQASSAASAFTLSKAGGGTIHLNNVTVKDCTGSPSGTWWAHGPGANVSGNTNWNFAPSLYLASARAVASARTLASARSAAAARTAL